MRAEISYLSIWLALLFAALTLIPAAIWMFRRFADNGEDNDDEAPYQKLNTAQILGKITKR